MVEPIAHTLGVLPVDARWCGLDAVIRRSEQRRAARWGIGAFSAIALVLVLVWLFGRGDLPTYAARVRAESFVWPVASTLIGLAALASLLVLGRSGTQERAKASRWLLIGLSGVIAVDVALLLLYARAGLKSYSAHLQDNDFSVARDCDRGRLAPPRPVGVARSQFIGAAWRQRGFRGLDVRGGWTAAGLPDGVSRHRRCTDSYAEYDGVRLDSSGAYASTSSGLFVGGTGLRDPTVWRIGPRLRPGQRTYRSGSTNSPNTIPSPL